MTPVIREIATGLKFPEGPIALPDGDVLLVEIARGTLSRVKPDGRVEVVAHTGGGPNGAAMGPDGKVWICNNGGFQWIDMGGGRIRPAHQPPDYSGGRIERVDLATGAVEVVYTHGPNGPLRGPNDLVFDADGGLWFTDLGKTRPRDLDYGAVYYARPDGSSIVEVVQPMLTPNGIGLSPDGKRLYVAETRAGRLWAWDIEGPGRVRKQPFPSPWGGTLMVDMSTYRLFDSLAVDAAGNVCIASLMEGGITVVPPEGGEVEFVPMPDVYTTNLCFGGPDLKTAFVTLSTTGKLVSIEWPRAGTPLNFLNR
ncbi:MAG: SMP-30/gluconolactonase/LRE family protein [Burkholderiales bacterium]|nr:MAG: SMP-30/gluconolactonase/LRE family protein [Burkholderiales bacterium]